MFLSAITAALHAEPISELQKQATNRYSQIGIHNIGGSVDVTGWKNIHWSARFCYELGSPRNVINGSLGAGYRMVIPLQRSGTDMLGHFIPISLGIKCNYYSWDVNSAYLGLEGSYNINVGSSIYQSFFALTGRLGLRLKMLDISLDYTYDLAPQFNQKYIYENPAFDFESLHSTIYERMQLGVRVAYYFTLGL